LELIHRNYGRIRKITGIPIGRIRKIKYGTKVFANLERKLNINN